MRNDFMKLAKREIDLLIHALGLAIRSDLTGADSTASKTLKREYNANVKRFIKLRTKLLESRATQ